ncbi:MAG: DnaJ C-terminal domain-containing protein [Oceanococcaceae bacterium]
MEFHDYYQTLGVSRDADTETIKKAYRRKAREFHPDRNAHAGAEDQFKKVQEAWEVLQDAEKRRMYDQLGANWKDGQSFRPPPGWDGFTGGAGGAAGPGGFSDFFQTLFGQAGGRGGFHGADGFGGFTGFGDTARAEPSHEAETQITLEEAFAGTTREIQRPGQSSLKVRIPAGTADGTRMRINAGGSTGTILLTIRYQDHPRYTVEGKNVSCELALAPWEAALGAKVKVPTLGGTIEMTIPAGAQSGQKLRLKGRGLPGTPPGDQFLRLELRYPTPVTEAQKALLQQWADSAADFQPRS